MSLAADRTTAVAVDVTFLRMDRRPAEPGPALPPGTGAEDGEWTGFYGAAELATGTGVSIGDVAAAVLLALFLYWGWDSTFSLTEESTTQRAPRVSAWVALGVVAAAYAAIGWAYAPGCSDTPGCCPTTTARAAATSPS